MKASRSLALCLFGYLACLIVVLGSAAAQDQEAALEVVMEVEAVGVSGPVTEFRAFNSTNFDNHPAKRAYTIAVSPTSGPVGASFAATYTADVVQGAWIGVFASGSSSTSTFKYLTTASGSVTFSTAGLAAGVYRVYLVSSSGTVRASASYTVTTAGTTPMPSPSAAPASSSPSAPAPSTGVSPAPSSSSAPAPSSSSAPAPSAGASPAPSGDAATWLSAHNAKRAQYGMPLLAWSTNLQTSAQNYANTLAAGCTFAHSGGQYGENLAMGHSSIAAVLTAWVDSEAQYYDPVTKTCVGGVCGHFTQVLWRMTSYVGCGIARCASNRPIYVCQYLRPGNCNGYNYESTSSPCGPLGP